jgi:hypothetical protein
MLSPRTGKSSREIFQFEIDVQYTVWNRCSSFFDLPVTPFAKSWKNQVFGIFDGKERFCEKLLICSDRGKAYLAHRLLDLSSSFGGISCKVLGYKCKIGRRIRKTLFLSFNSLTATVVFDLFSRVWGFFHDFSDLSPKIWKLTTWYVDIQTSSFHHRCNFSGRFRNFFFSSFIWPSNG